VVEDAAQAIMSTYKGKDLGTIGHMGTFSFHETKNITSAGEGGLLIINDEKFTQRAEIIREKGTNRSQFFRGMVDKYSWVDIGSSYLMNDVSAAYLWGQLEKIENIQKDRLKSWNRYYNGLKELEQKRLLELPKIPSNCQNNAHIFYIKVKNLEQRASLIRHLKENDICAVFHYVPLHSSPAGVRFGRFDGVDTFTTKESEKIIRLPIYYRLDDDRLEYILKTIKCFFGSNDG
jgi:dTDP-4-amino-4,6-dideoxygalactose transaminase